ncbi:MAG: hypothetical protein KJ804_18130 [Proteobacteria bacterium]|nr:hypothetical protein [Pseudomonadota bacterium]MBU1060226.1 hypothetical protein [Pseudomonadota bacterium]
MAICCVVNEKKTPDVAGMQRDPKGYYAVVAGCYPTKLFFRLFASPLPLSPVIGEVDRPLGVPSVEQKVRIRFSLAGGDSSRFLGWGEFEMEIHGLFMNEKA